MEARWADRVQMAPFAEALGITTDSVMFVVRSGEGWVVLFTETPTAEPGELIHSALLRYDAWGILQVVRRRPYMTIAMFSDGLDDHMRKVMEGRDDG